MYIGEAFIGEGANAAHINVFVGEKNGVVGSGLTASVAAPRMGYIPFMAIHKPNVPVKPATLFAAKADFRNDTHANMTWGPAQAGVARGVQEAVDEGILPAEAVDEWCIIAGVWVNWEANDADTIYKHNTEAMKTALKRAMNNEPTAQEINLAMSNPSNPFYTPPK
jgi:5,6,7,8-tetrahydromethanopterin hydro-lyase